MEKVIAIKERVLSANDKKAQELRNIYDMHNKFVINLMSSPGSGKTTLLESLSQFDDFRFCVIEGDLETNRDADRLEKQGVLAKQITTGEACHLEASMIANMLPSLMEDSRFNQSDFLFIENVGNLVCPASYDLGANVNVVLLSVPEGDDKVLKYPSMFLCADIVLITKAEMKEYFGFKTQQVESDLASLRYGVDIMEISKDSKESLKNLKEYFQALALKGYRTNHIFK
ncbi:MAG: hydrogenase nickel incorporation protein HypB [Helicobacter trogontum]|uniref:hydrogenase nickel incorporation protein HypB n=1 Tax=Helicobacter trogontum TaxID=50960 RepID=UPI00242BBCC3|nr:hydrogenase nickel incorporation protein HypB [Helicobacter trogontum]MCI5786576.1 hydrogenase nickel incorporation protein HypB [Helicobacter trogontum]